MSFSNLEWAPDYEMVMVAYKQEMSFVYDIVYTFCFYTQTHYSASIYNNLIQIDQHL